MSLSNYLVQRGKRGIWQLRVPVPRPLQTSYGKRERVKSMGTSDRALASRLAQPVLAAWRAEWASSGQPQTAGEIALQQHRAILDQIESHRRNSGDDDAQDAAIRGWQGEMRKVVRKRFDGDMESWSKMANRIIANQGFDIRAGTPEYDELVEALADATVDALSVFTRRHEGEPAAEPQSKTLRLALQRKETIAPPGETLLELFDRYAEQRAAEGAKRPDVLKQDRKVMEQFADFVGKTRRLETIAPEDVRAFRDALRKLPTRWRERKELAGLGMREAAAKAETLSLPRVTLTTVNKYLSTISPLFTWLIKEQYNITNPVANLLHQRVKGKNPRPPFTTEQLNKILASPLFRGFEADGKEHKPGGVKSDDWRRWLPLLAMFTGARVGELAQLHVGDIEQHETGVWFATIRHDDATGQTTKSGHSRPAIIHSRLIAIGFLDFVDRQRSRSATDGNPQLFPELEANKRDQIGAKPSEFWRDYLTAIGIKSGRDGFGVHSFRHTMADRLREEAGLLDDQIEVALGHNQKTVTGGYGRIRQGTVPLLGSMMEGVTFKGVDFTGIITGAVSKSC
ncbi:tyrosine-type recombinase/integrase [Sphingomonas aliaeris]|uniref:Tyrosine-type recombinase/integrase n=1 Tax=Sphingomonas aliaeris TaxID=2759526 RepID=A0A974NS57_9SPHN|nr:DUF6538 domain-containing protein [Sphingomonas aliaeris]QQV75877.1 tyrosine-type recombinase/integrase [Sphingomonas aliaeris]